MNEQIAKVIATIIMIVPTPNKVAVMGVIFVPFSVKSSLSYHAPGSTTFPFQSIFKIPVLLLV